MTFLRTVLPIAGLLLSGTQALAQFPAPATDPRWYPFLGCWATSAPGYKGPTVCLLPTDSLKTVDVVAVMGDSVLSRTTVTADGQRRRLAREGCEGWETATWSQDDRRLFTRAEFTCGGGPTQTTTGIYAMNHNEAFARVEGVKTRGGTRARVVNFEWIDTVRVPSSVAVRLPNFMGLNILGARVESAAEVTTADVVEATKTVEADVVEAWLANRGQSFNVAARDLRALRDAKVPSQVIDMMVAVSYPKVFAVQPGMAPDARAPQASTRGMSSVDRLALEREMRLRSSLAYGWGDMLFPYSGFGYADPFFSPIYGSFFNRWNPYFDPFFYRGGWYNNGFNTGVYGGFVNGFNYGGNTIIGNGPYIITPAQPTRPEPGRVINGLGYSASGGSGGGSAQPSPSVSPSGGYSGGGSSPVSAQPGGGYSGGGGGSASGGGEQRTAKPRP